MATDTNAHALIVGDREIAREGLTRLLQENGFHASCVVADDAMLSSPPFDDLDHDWKDDREHLFVLDISSRELLLSLCRLLRERYPSTCIAVIGDVADHALIHGVLNAGADGFLPSLGSLHQIVAMLSLLMLGEKVVPTNFLDSVVRATPTPRATGISRTGAVDALSEREGHILRYLVDGEANKVIARKLGISEATVKVHVKAVLRKLNVTNRTQAAIWGANSR